MSVVTVAEAKTHLNITVSTFDTELQAFLDRAEAAISRRVGPLTSTATTYKVDGGSTTLRLPVTPAISLTSVTPLGGTALTLADLDLDTGAGIVRFVAGGTFTATLYTVVYQAGRTTVPEDLKLAILELLRHLWRTQRGSAQRPGTVSDEPVAAYAFPYSVLELLGPHLQVP